jgi:hypothetical protein
VIGQPGNFEVSYIEKIAHRHHLEDRKPARTPLPTVDDVLAKCESMNDGKASAQDILLCDGLQSPYAREISRTVSVTWCSVKSSLRCFFLV